MPTRPANKDCTQGSIVRKSYCLRCKSERQSGDPCGQCRLYLTGCSFELCSNGHSIMPRMLGVEVLGRTLTGFNIYRVGDSNACSGIDHRARRNPVNCQRSGG